MYAQRDNLVTIFLTQEAAFRENPASRLEAADFDEDAGEEEAEGEVMRRRQEDGSDLLSESDRKVFICQKCHRDG